MRPGFRVELAQRTGLTEGAISYLRSGQRSRRSNRSGALVGAAELAVRCLNTEHMDSIESAIADIRDGKMVIVLDDEDARTKATSSWRPRRSRRRDQLHA